MENMTTAATALLLYNPDKLTIEAAIVHKSKPFKAVPLSEVWQKHKEDSSWAVNVKFEFWLSRILFDSRALRLVRCAECDTLKALRLQEWQNEAERADPEIIIRG